MRFFFFLNILKISENTLCWWFHGSVGPRSLLRRDGLYVMPQADWLLQLHTSRGPDFAVVVFIKGLERRRFRAHLVKEIWLEVRKAAISFKTLDKESLALPRPQIGKMLCFHSVCTCRYPQRPEWGVGSPTVVLNPGSYIRYPADQTFTL